MIIKIYHDGDGGLVTCIMMGLMLVIKMLVLVSCAMVWLVIMILVIKMLVLPGGSSSTSHKTNQE